MAQRRFGKNEIVKMGGTRSVDCFRYPVKTLAEALPYPSETGSGFCRSIT